MQHTTNLARLSLLTFDIRRTIYVTRLRLVTYFLPLALERIKNTHCMGKRPFLYAALCPSVCQSHPSVKVKNGRREKVHIMMNRFLVACLTRGDISGSRSEVKVTRNPRREMNHQIGSRVRMFDVALPSRVVAIVQSRSVGRD